MNQQPLRGGPETCPRPCSVCEGADHHWGYHETAESEPDHPAAKAGLEIWDGCKHCEAWRDVPDDDESGEYGIGLAECRICGYRQLSVFPIGADVKSLECANCGDTTMELRPGESISLELLGGPLDGQIYKVKPDWPVPDMITLQVESDGKTEAHNYEPDRSAGVARWKGKLDAHA